MAYEPTEWKSGDVVTSAKLNKMEGGIENASLPAVTSDDNGDVLTVVEGAWAKAAPVSGILVVGATEEGGTITLDKTWQEIHDAKICFIDYSSKSGSSTDTVIVHPVTQIFIDDGQYVVIDSLTTYYAESANGYPSFID